MKLKLTFFLVAMLCGVTLFASNDSISLIPEIHGTFRGRYEVATRNGEQRFQVRNARLSLAGRISHGIDYFFQTDLCDRGKMKILDAWGRLSFTRRFALKGGQFRMPFGVETFKAPHNYLFANRAFLAKQMCNYRAVGAQLSFTFPHMPLTLEAGAFNPSTIGDHTGWHKKMAYSAKATYKTGNVLLSTGIMSIEPDSVRSNMLDGAVVWNAGRWSVAGEYIYQHYTNKAHKAAHGYMVMADYAMPIHIWEFNKLSFQGRFDGMTDQSTGIRNADGELTTNNPSRNRITVGSTLTYLHSKGIYADFRLNYEKYFYHSGVEITPDMADKFVAELVIRF